MVSYSKNLFQQRFTLRLLAWVLAAVFLVFFMVTMHEIFFTTQKNELSSFDKSPFYLPCKKLIFVRLQIFLQAGCKFLHPEELSSHAKNFECGYWCSQIWLRILHNWHFLKYFVQIPKNNSNKSCIKCTFAAH